jgi:hypothetical protein
VVNGRVKGAVAEREACDELNAALPGIAAERMARNGIRGACDVKCAANIHFEIKRREKVAVVKWMEQAARDAGGAVPVVVHRTNRNPWLVTLPLSEVAGFVDEIVRVRS